MHLTNVSQAKATLSKLLAAVERGEDVVIGRAGRPIARLVRFEADGVQAIPGALRGKIRMAPDFDAWPEEEARALGIID